MLCSLARRQAPPSRAAGLDAAQAWPIGRPSPDIFCCHPAPPARSPVLYKTISFEQGELSVVCNKQLPTPDIGQADQRSGSAGARDGWCVPQSQRPTENLPAFLRKKDSKSQRKRPWQPAATRVILLLRYQRHHPEVSQFDPPAPSPAAPHRSASGVPRW